jgi:ubiquinone/menaquinone biosynthesis C-methylase UbiE
MKQQGQPILDHLTALADPIRSRMLLLLERNELTVGELCTILQLPQSTVSRHLKTLSDTSWAVSRRDGTSRYYRLADNAGESAPPRLWSIVREEVYLAPSAQQDARRLESVLAARRTQSQAFFASAAGQWDRLRAELFGQNFCSVSILGLLDERWVVGDLGCGTGQVAAMLAPFVRRLIAVDASTEMLSAARERLRAHDNAIIRQGVLERLPIEGDSLDVAVFLLVLHHLPDPAVALGEAARVLRPQGKLLIVDMVPHQREEYKQQMGHVWLGFSEEQMQKYLNDAGLGQVSFHPVPPQADAKGPALFSAVARKNTVKSDHPSRSVAGLVKDAV